MLPKSHNASKICYTTLAVGYEYNLHAQQLVKDVLRLSPNIPIVVLTDRPNSFCKNQNVIPIKHTIKSVGIFHDKLHCVEKSLERFETCIFLDADCRLIEDISQSRDWKPGLTTKSCWNLKEHVVRKKQCKLAELADLLICDVAKEFELSLDHCKFINEAVFIVRSDNHKELEFLKIWKTLRDRFEFSGVFSGEGAAMGLAAVKAGLNVYKYDADYGKENVKDIYKDKLFHKFLFHQEREGLTDDLCQKILEFDRQRRKIQSLPFEQKVIRKTVSVVSPTMKILRLAKLKIKGFINPVNIPSHKLFG
ncbi:MAG: hypothetical protein AAF821_20940 [Cyanobacteria bacterium P01_D01_bin.156]